MSGSILFKFRNARGEPESVTFDGIHITALELKNLIAEKKGLTDSALELSDPKTKTVFDDNHVFPRGSAVTVRRVAASKAQTRAQQAATAADATEEVAAGPAMAALQTLAASCGPTAPSVDPSDENAQLEQRKANQGKEDAEIGLLVSAQDEAWRAQSDKNILATRAREQQLAAQRGRGRGFGSSFMHGRGRGAGGQPTGFCKFCGKMNDHYSDDCPHKHNPRTDLRHVRAPAGIPAELLEQSSEGGLLLHSGKTGALKASTDLAAQAFAALPTAAKRAPALPALANAPHEQQDEQAQLLLENGNQQDHKDEQEDAEAAGLDKLGVDEASQEPAVAAAAAAADLAPAAADAAPDAAAPAAADIDTEDAYLFDDDFDFGTAKESTPAGGLFDDDDGLAADGAVGQLNLGMGMQLPESEQLDGDSQQRQPSRSPLKQRLQEPSSPVKQQQQQVQQQSPARSAGEEQQQDKQAEAAGLKPVDPLQYCNDIILATVPDAKRWALKDIKQAFIHDRPLTPDEFSALLAKYKPPAPVTQQPQQREEQLDVSRRRSKEESSRRRSRSRSPVRSQSGSRSHSHDRAGSKRQRKAERSPRRRSRSRSRSRSHSRDRRSKHRSSKNKRDKSPDKTRDERHKAAAARESQQREARATEKRSPSPVRDDVSDKQKAGGAEQGIDRPANLATSGPSQDLIALLEDVDQQPQQQAAVAASDTAKPAPAEEAVAKQAEGSPAAVGAASPKVESAAAVTTPGSPAAAAAIEEAAVAEKPAKRRPITSRKRRPITSRLGPQPRSPVRTPTPEPEQLQEPSQQQQQQQDHAQGKPAADAVGERGRSRSRNRSSSRRRSSSRSVSKDSGSSQQRRHSGSRSRSVSSGDSRGRQQQSAGAAAASDEEEKLNFGDSDADEYAAAAASRGGSESSREHSSDREVRGSRRRKHGSSKRSKREKKDRKAKKDEKKRHRSDRHRSRSVSRSRSRQGRRRGRYSRSRSLSSRSRSRDRSRSPTPSRSRSRSPEAPPAKRTRSNTRPDNKQEMVPKKQPGQRESIASRLGGEAVVAAGGGGVAAATRASSGRIADAAKRPAPAGGAGRLLGRAFQALGGAASGRSQLGRAGSSGQSEGSKRTRR